MEYHGTAVIPAIDATGAVSPRNRVVYVVGIYNPDCAVLKEYLKVTLRPITRYSDQRLVNKFVKPGKDVNTVAVVMVIPCATAVAAKAL